MKSAPLGRLALLTTCFTLLGTASAPAQLLITEVVDGTLTGAAPKWIEVTNFGTENFTFGVGGGIIIQANAATDTVVDLVMSGVTINAGDVFVISASNTDQHLAFQDVYGFAPDYLGGTATFGNGDDRYAITASGTDAAGGVLIDIYGTFGVDGSGTVWDYEDGYAFRKAGVLQSNNGVYDPDNWTYGGVNSLEAAFESDTSYDPLEIELLRNLTTPGVHPVPEPSIFAGLAVLAGLFLHRWHRRRS